MTPTFEVPYNFNFSLIAFYKKFASCVNYLYIPPYKDDAPNTRTSIETKRKGLSYMPQTRSEYEEHLRLISDAGLEFVTLWQLPHGIIPHDMLDYYSRLGTSGFIIANDLNAAIIKDFSPDLTVVGSLVQRICAGVTQRDFSLYDQVVPYYPFNRALDALKRLAFMKEKIILMPNTFCSIDCPSMFHWFPNKERGFNFKRDCMSMRSRTENTYAEHCAFIPPEHLTFFDDHVGGYKLQGRESTTEIIKYVCRTYFHRRPSDELLDVFIGEEMSSILTNAWNSMTPERYYNIRTDELIKVM